MTVIFHGMTINLKRCITGDPVSRSFITTPLLEDSSDTFKEIVSLLFIEKELNQRFLIEESKSVFEFF